jgi:DNA ligase-1
VLPFEKLYQKLDQTTKTTEKVEALVEFFHLCSPQDKIWIIALFTGRRPKRSIPLALLRQWAAEFAQIPQWLFDESYHTVGDLAETISLVLGKTSTQVSNNNSLDFWIQQLHSLRQQDEETQKETLFQFWKELSTEGRFLLNKLITGGFRIGVSQALLLQALSKYTEIPKDDLSYRISGKWDPFKTTFEQLILNPDLSSADSKPYPFFLAHPITEDYSTFIPISNWQFEYKWDGIRGQLIKRNDTVALWSRGEELISHSFPEIVESISSFRGMALRQESESRHTETIQQDSDSHQDSDSQQDSDSIVLDGEIIAWNFVTNQPLPFSDLQRRIGRKTVGKKLRQEIPSVFLAYDILEINQQDLRKQPLSTRRTILEQVLPTTPLYINTISDHTDSNSVNRILLPPLLHPQTWLEAQNFRQEAKTQKAEGLMVKLRSSEYGVGRKRGDWWKWKIEPETIDAVLIYAQRGHGKRANLYTDFTFALKNGELLTPFAKAYSGLSNAEIEELNRWIKQHTRESFGPVRSVEPFHVFEIGFEAVLKSKRHKSGVAVRFPRIVRWRKDKTANDIGTIEDLLSQAN